VPGVRSGKARPPAARLLDLVRGNSPGMDVLRKLMRAWRRHDERLADEAVREAHAEPDRGRAAEGEYDALRAGGVMGSRSDELDIEGGARD
jgi:hypothetical protein